jgi:hypothetical protein
MKKLLFLILLIIIYLQKGFAIQNEKSVEIDPNCIIEWNQLVLSIAVKEDKLLTLKGVRSLSMMHIAMHDVLNNIDRRFKNYIFKEKGPNAHKLAAVIESAYQVALNQYPKYEIKIIKIRQRWLDKIKVTETKIEGIAFGKKSASKILEFRSNDLWNSDAEYTWHPMAPGVYAEFNEHSQTPQGFVFGAGWAKAVPFVLTTQDQFQAPPPPEINSETYTKAFNEVKIVGSNQSIVRTSDQTHLAMWWKDFVENSHNRLARDLASKENLNIWETARLFALLNMSIYDAYIDVFYNKFHYNHWRPYTAIRWAAFDGNPQTQPDTSWNNLHKHTYAFPSYPSAHGCASTAAMTILENVFGENYAFEMRIPEVDKAGPMSEKFKMNPQTRSFENFMQAAMECSLSRVYLGIHFRYDSVEGYNLGRKIGKYALENFLQTSE